MVTVTGKAEVKAYISGIPAKIAPVLRGAAKAGAAVFKDEIYVETISDEVRNNLQVNTKTKDGRVVSTVSIKKGYARSIGTWLEYGTSPHFISVDESQRGGKSIRKLNEAAGGDALQGSLVVGGKFIGQTVWHPGTRPRPAFRPTLDKKGAEATAAAQTYIRDAVARGLTSAGGEE